jgi:hypothetical protein
LPRKLVLKWPSDYIEDAPISITQESFERAIRRHPGPSKQALALFQGNEAEHLLTHLFRIACIFQRSANGISAMKKARIHTKLASFEKVITQHCDRNSNEFLLRLEKWKASGHPWERDYARSFLSQPSALRQEFTGDWVRENRFQRVLASDLNRKRLKQEFTANLDIYLRPRLREKTINGEPLGKKKQQTYLNSLIGAIMLAVGETWTSSNKVQESARLRQQRSRSLIQRRPGPEEMNEEELHEYVQVGQAYMRGPDEKKRSRGGRK